MERFLQLTTERYKLAATIHYPTVKPGEARGRYGAVIICHGFIGSRIGVNRLFVKTARALADENYMVVRFDYAGCGESEGEYGGTGLDSMIEQTRAVLDYVMSLDCIDPQQVVLLGHSLGGAVALLAAANDRRVKTLILWAPVANPFHDITRIVGKHVYEESVKTGAADHEGFTLFPAFFESLHKHHPSQEARRVHGDVLLVHGTSDETIPVDYSLLYQKEFWTRSDGICDRELILGSDHTFSTGEAQSAAIGSTINWLRAAEARRKDWNNWTI